MAHLNFAWDYEDQTGITFNLYENDAKVVPDIGRLDFSLLMDGKAEGTYEYYVTAEDKAKGLESIPSNVVSVNFTFPESPTNLRASWIV